MKTSTELMEERALEYWYDELNWRAKWRAHWYSPLFLMGISIFKVSPNNKAFAKWFDNQIAEAYEQHDHQGGCYCCALAGQGGMPPCSFCESYNWDIDVLEIL